MTEAGERTSDDPAFHAPAPAAVESRRAPRWRTIVAVVLVVLAALLAPLAVTAYWVHERILSTEGWVDTVGPLAANEDVTDAVAARVVNTIFERADVQNRITDVLPGPVDALGKTFSNSLRSFATDRTERFLESDTFQELWDRANRLAHEQVVAMFTGKGDAVSAHDDRIVLDLGVVADKVRLQLVDRGVGILKRVSIPKDSVEVTLVESDTVRSLQPMFRILDDLSTVLPIAFVVVVVAAIGVAPRRRRVVIATGCSVAAATALLAAGINVFRRRYVDAVSARHLDVPAAKAVFDTLTGALREWVWLVVVLALVVAAAAFVSDPRRIERLTRALHGDRVANRTGVAPWVREHRVALRLAAVVLAVLVVAVWPSPTWWVVVLVAVVLAVVLGVITALGRLAAVTSPATPARP